MPDVIAKRYAPWLWTLFGFFCIRVMAQLLALRIDIPVLPEFDAWHSSVVPYPVLVVSQILIVALLFQSARRFSKGTVAPRRRTGRILLVLASLYAGTMLARLLLGLTVLHDHAWFNHYLPTFFHLILAAFLGLVGHYHYFGATHQEATHERAR